MHWGLNFPVSYREEKAPSCHGWVIHRPSQGWRWWNETLIHRLHHSEPHYSCSGQLLCVTDVCSSVILWLSIFTHLTLRDSSCIFSTRPDLIFKTLNSGTTVTQTIDNEEHKAMPATENTTRKTRRNFIMTRHIP